MKFKIFIFFIIIICTFTLLAQESVVKPVNPNTTKEAVELLNIIYNISGKYTLTGQHTYPAFGTHYNELVYDYVKDYPVVVGMDFGFDERNSKDGINFRQQLVDEAIGWHEKGAVITLMWHAVPPTMEEPVKFRGGIQSKLTDEEWNDLITPGTEIHQRWCKQVDVIAYFLKQIQDENIPVLWRPYHEMNGGWFWWGKKKGENGYKKLYVMLYDRLVNYHKINNLLWVFNANFLGPGKDPYEPFYPGADYVDILATDVYRNQYTKATYEDLLKLANGKPVALGEVGEMPTESILKKQPEWAWFMTWCEVLHISNKWNEIQNIYNSDKTLTLEEYKEFLME